MTMIGNEERYSRASSDTVVEVVLGVDRHLDVLCCGGPRSIGQTPGHL